MNYITSKLILYECGLFIMPSVVVPRLATATSTFVVVLTSCVGLVSGFNVLLRRIHILLE
jgi:hypothetical protein